MGWSLAVGASQTTNEGANQSTVTVDTYLSWTGGASFYGITHTGRVNIGGVDYYYSTPSSVNYPNPTSSGTIRVDTTSRTITHDNNGVRGSITTWADLSGSVTGYLSASGPTQPALDYDRKPSQPSNVTAVVNSDKSITVTVAAVSSPAGTPTYYCAYSQNGGGWTGTASSASNVFNFPALQRGATYSFLGYASNSDGTSAATASSSSYFLAAGGKMSTGSGFNSLTTAKINTGSGWRDLTTAKINTGSGWVDLP